MLCSYASKHLKTHLTLRSSLQSNHFDCRLAIIWSMHQSVSVKQSTQTYITIQSPRAPVATTLVSNWFSPWLCVNKNVCSHFKKALARIFKHFLYIYFCKKSSAWSHVPKALCSLKSLFGLIAKNITIRHGPDWVPKLSIYFSDPINAGLSTTALELPPPTSGVFWYWTLHTSFWKLFETLSLLILSAQKQFKILTSLQEQWTHALNSTQNVRLQALRQKSIHFFF